MSDKYPLITLSKIRNILEKFQKRKSHKTIFYHLCFCICVPQAKYKGVLKTVQRLKEHKFYTTDIPYSKLVSLIPESRFKNKKARYLLEAKQNFKTILDIIDGDNDISDNREARSCLVSNIRGLGFKAASHFLRNLGAADLAIIDTHIIKYLNLKQKPKNEREYLEIEKEFKKIAEIRHMTVAELDAVIWAVSSNTKISEFKY